MPSETFVAYATAQASDGALHRDWAVSAAAGTSRGQVHIGLQHKGYQVQPI